MPEETIYKGLPAHIYRANKMPDCSMRGISSKFDEVLVIMEEKDSQIFNSSEDMPAVRIVRRILSGKEYIHAEPVTPGSYMFGGTYITCSDGRFSRHVSRYPIALHDRQEFNRSD